MRSTTELLSVDLYILTFIAFLFNANYGIDIWVLRDDKKYADLLKNLARKESLTISTITIAEIYKNVYPAELLKTENLLNELQSFDVTPLIAKQAGLYWQEYSEKLKK